jgi:hypothetical protein
LGTPPEPTTTWRVGTQADSDEMPQNNLTKYSNPCKRITEFIGENPPKKKKVKRLLQSS